jgi:hypothetical protein
MAEYASKNLVDTALAQIQSAEHGDALLPQRIVDDFAFIVDDHGGTILHGMHRPVRQFRGIGISRPRERDSGVADLISEGDCFRAFPRLDRRLDVVKNEGDLHAMRRF